LFNTAYVERMGLLILYAEREWRESVDVERYLADNGMAGMKYVVLFDRPAAGNMRESIEGTARCPTITPVSRCSTQRLKG
jgi:hypothetical protein